AAGSAGGSTDGGAGSGGASGDGGPRDSGGSDATSAFKLTSMAFMEGGNFPAANTCTGGSTSPSFEWTPGPAATMSYAIVLPDKSNVLPHGAIGDTPPATMSLPANLPKTATLTMPAGAKQNAFQGGNGYQGPCPPTGTHTYEFALYAVDVGTLPGVTTN